MANANWHVSFIPDSEELAWLESKRLVSNGGIEVKIPRSQILKGIVRQAMKADTKSKKE